ncbi:hypothetical protein [Streptomyces sp. NBC_01264]|uniref:hypothetical protein n=1 Tax=Streptomyces sp. NBC_01264 TaxID=2903804 RepID=UPI002259EA25|nr:hypothetical protein [Streptomyces sp. NBC_01264]MCX4783435.1 hypothetical protein [Streptomyces sp. NBC_01264]
MGLPAIDSCPADGSAAVELTENFAAPRTLAATPGVPDGFTAATAARRPARCRPAANPDALADFSAECRATALSRAARGAVMRTAGAPKCGPLPGGGFRNVREDA